MTNKPDPREKNAGFEEGLGLSNNGGGNSGFDAIMELATSRTKAEEWLIRSNFTPLGVHLRVLEAEDIQECDGYTDSEMSNWKEDQMTPAIGGARVNLVADMVIAATNRQAPPPRASGFDAANGVAHAGGPMGTGSR